MKIKQYFIFLAVCPRIPMCEFRRCMSPFVSPYLFQNKCLFCKYENAHTRYERAYKYKTSSNACERKY